MTAELTLTDPLPAAPDALGLTVAINESLILRSIRQHELTEAAENLNAQLHGQIAAREKIADEATETARVLATTARELAEKARLLDLTDDAIIVRNVAGHISYWNHGAEVLYGWSSAEALGQVSHILLQTVFPTPLKMITAELHRNGRWTGELTHTARDGRRLTVLVRKTLDRDSAGNPAAVLQTLTDITERKVAEEALRESEAFNRSIIESSPDCIKVLDLEGNLLSIEAGQELLGITDLAPLLHQPWTEFWESAEDRATAQRVVAQAAAGGEGRFIGFFRTLRGEDKWWDVVITPVRDASGQPARLLAVSRDVTERRLLNNSLVARAADLVRADRSKDEFLAMLAHELRNPLAPLSNAAEILSTAEVTDAERGQAQRIIVRQIENMSRMIDDLLDVSRITEGKIELRKKAVSLEAILTAATSLARSGCSAHHQDLALSMPGEPVWLDADATRLEQVFGNLLTNASKYAGDGCQIALNATRDAREVIVTVSDDGAGIAPELLPRIFDLFVQASRTLDRTHGGLGIGLTLVRRLVNLHGGSIEARSEGLGHGSQFIVRLPILAEPPPAPAPTPIPAQEIPRRILIVDDNTDSARSLAILQTRRGHITQTAFTGPAAVSTAAEFLPEVVLLDIGLPGMDGYAVARQLRAMPALHGVFIIAMSGYGHGQDRAQAKAAGFDEYMVKPLNLATLREWLAARGHQPG
jgi:PAS domain S-box-containing protein